MALGGGGTHWCSILTCFVVLQVSSLLAQWDYFVCPIAYDELTESISLECQRSATFTPYAYSLPTFIAKTGALVSARSPVWSFCSWRRSWIVRR